MRPIERPWLRGALLGLLLAGAQALEMLAGNRRTINPGSAAFLLALWSSVGAVIGAASGWLGARSFATLRLHAADGAAFLSAVVVGGLLIPPGLGLVLGLALLALLFARRRILPRRSRLDGAVALALVGILTLGLTDPSVLPPPERPHAPFVGGTPLPGSVPVTISVSRGVKFPDIPALHVPLRPLDSGEPGQRASLWTGRAPERTRAGKLHPRRLPGGGGLSWWPGRTLVRSLVNFFPEVRSIHEPPFAPRASLMAMVEGAGIPVIRARPGPDDPPLFLRILTDELPDPELAARLRRDGAWIHVNLDREHGGAVALSGEGISVQPRGEPASLMDVAPTALHLLGLAIPRDADGRVLLEYLAFPGPGERDPRYRAGSS